MGPAFLVYYSPAFLRTVAKSHPLAALQILACIYRGARELWPFDTRDGASPSPTTNCLPSLRALAERPAALERMRSRKFASMLFRYLGWNILRTTINTELGDRHDSENVAGGK